MAFMIDATMKGYKVLGVKTGTSKKGNTFKSLSLFRDGRTAEVSVTDPQLFGAVDALSELDVVNVDVRAVSGKDRSWISLHADAMQIMRHGIHGLAQVRDNATHEEMLAKEPPGKARVNGHEQHESRRHG